MSTDIDINVNERNPATLTKIQKQIDGINRSLQTTLKGTGSLSTLAQKVGGRFGISASAVAAGTIGQGTGGIGAAAEDISRFAAAELGLKTGAYIGSRFGPWGTIIGGTIGTIAGVTGANKIFDEITSLKSRHDNFVAANEIFGTDIVRKGFRDIIDYKHLLGNRVEKSFDEIELEILKSGLHISGTTRKELAHALTSDAPLSGSLNDKIIAIAEDMNKIAERRLKQRSSEQVEY